MPARRPLVFLGPLALTAVVMVVLLWPRPGPATAGGPALVGDVNCDGNVNSLDALFISQYNAGLLASLPCPQNADGNGDLTMSAIDAALIVQFDAGMIDSLPPPRSELVGDVNCDGRVNSADALLILQLHARLLAALACQQNADVNGDGSIDSIDATLIIQFGVGPPLPLPPP